MTSKELPIKTMSQILDVNLSNVYYTKDTSLLYNPYIVKKIIDNIHVDNPSWGYKIISNQLKSLNYYIGERTVKRYLSEMYIHAINSNSLNKKFSYLLHNVKLKHPNQAWSIAITYIPLKYTAAYLVIIIDCYSFYIINWILDYNLDTNLILEFISSSFKNNIPEIINSDQSTIFLNTDYIYFLQNHNVNISMYNKYYWSENIIDKWFRNLKYNEVYLNNYINIYEAKNCIEKYIYNYNHNENNELLNSKIPNDVYYNLTLLEK